MGYGSLFFAIGFAGCHMNVRYHRRSRPSTPFLYRLMCLPLRQGVTDVIVETEQEIESEALFSSARFAVN